jgi:hypothetical protein
VVSEAGLGQTARLSSVDITLSVDDGYRNPLGA